MWDLSSPTRDQTCVPCIGSVESYPLDRQGSPPNHSRLYVETGPRHEGVLGPLLGNNFSLVPHVLLKGHSWALAFSSKK